MELDDLKKLWTKINEDESQPKYSVEQIAEFRKTRSKDFSSWIQNGLVLDIILKSFFILAFVYLIILMGESPGFLITAIGIIIVSLLLILLEYKHFRSSKNLDRQDTSVQESIRSKLKFIKTYYYRIQFMQGLSNPIFVSAGICYFYYTKYGEIRLDDFESIAVVAIILVVSFLFTLPTTLSLYGYHYRVLKASLASLENEEEWTMAIDRYNRQKKVLYWILGSLLFIGLLAIIILIFL